MRLDKYLSHASALSRDESRRTIRSGRLTVDGQVITDPTSRITEQQVCLDGEPLRIAGARYFMLNKPLGHVSATRDAEHPTVLDLFPAELAKNLKIAGRLDIDTSGLVLLSDDGKWLHKVSNARSGCRKTYLVTLHSPLEPTALQGLREGILLRGESRPTRPAQCEILPDGRVEITITEGRYHQVKRMFAACNNRVTALHRQQVGHIILPDDLASGAYRELSEEQIKGFL